MRPHRFLQLVTAFLCTVCHAFSPVLVVPVSNHKITSQNQSLSELEAVVIPHQKHQKGKKEDITVGTVLTRRDWLSSLALLSSTMAVTTISAPQQAQAKAASTFFFDEKIETVMEPAQMATGDKLDLNAAFVVCIYFPSSSGHDTHRCPELGHYEARVFSH